MNDQEQISLGEVIRLVRDTREAFDKLAVQVREDLLAIKETTVEDRLVVATIKQQQIEIERWHIACPIARAATVNGQFKSAAVESTLKFGTIDRQLNAIWWFAALLVGGMFTTIGTWLFLAIRHAFGGS